VRVTVSPQALRRFNESLDLLYPIADPRWRDQIIDRVFDHVELLSRYPGLGAIEPQLEHLKMGHRRLIVGHFKIIYRILPSEIIVLDIFDSRQDPDRMLRS
jgi:toxin ParE1/3/4